MTAPALTRKLVLEQSRLLPDEAGGFARSWEALGVLWASLDALSGREQELAGGLPGSSVPYKITVRSAAPGSPQRPRPEQRFREGTRVLRIIAVADDDPSGRYLVCHAREEVVA